jgi:hypothetical protein
MTGPEHFREAELMLQTTDEEDHYRSYHLRAAQVHATLAVAAALDPQVTDAEIARRVTGEMTQS